MDAISFNPPKEILTHIGGFLDFYSLTISGRVCRTWKDCMDSDALWRLRWIGQELAVPKEGVKKYVRDHYVDSLQALSVRIKLWASRLEKGQYKILIGAFLFDSKVFESRNCPSAPCFRLQACLSLHSRIMRGYKNIEKDYLFINLPKSEKISPISELCDDHNWKLQRREAMSQTVGKGMTKKYLSFCFTIPEQNLDLDYPESLIV